MVREQKGEKQDDKEGYSYCLTFPDRGLLHYGDGSRALAGNRTVGLYYGNRDHLSPLPVHRYQRSIPPLVVGEVVVRGG